uniref:Selenoprotein M n=1 Tax=Myripristis murdjan TaxID=586833 RepID=A0A667ZX23_9TELE
MRWMTAEQAERGQSLCDPGYSSLVSFTLGVMLLRLLCISVKQSHKEMSHKFHHFLSVSILDRYLFSHNLVMKHIPGADPELVLLNHYYEELDRIALSDMTRSEINELLKRLGFYKKDQPEDEVPEEFRFSPAKDSPFKDTPESQSSSSSSSSRPAESTSSEPSSEAKHSDL